MSIVNRIDVLIGEDEAKYLTKSQQKKLPANLKAAIVKSKKGKNEEVSEAGGLIGCRDCGSKVPKPSSFPGSCPDCGSSIKRPYSFRRATPGRQRRKPRG